MTSHLPFSSVVGQDDAKLALILAAVEPRLGGVLLRGDKGSAKTTLARGFAALLPGRAPFVELPLGAGEDRVIGAIDVAALLDARKHTFRPGLLAAAHGGVLYVDEVNLLPDHLVDALLDVAVSGVNRVERDGFSETHPARFVLVGSMNPEEGELRPQLLDRFGLSVEVRASDDPEVRAEIVRRQLAFEATGEADGTGDDEIRAALETARPVRCGREVVLAAARLAVAVGAQGLRADLALCRAAGALAGWEGRESAVPEDLRRVSPLVLGHRRRREPFEAPGIASDQLSSALDEALGEAGSSPGEAGRRRPRSDADGPAGPSTTGDGDTDGDTESGSGGESRPGDSPGSLSAPPPLPDPEIDAQSLSLPRGGGSATALRGAAGRSALAGSGSRGRRIGQRPFRDAGERIDGSATAVSYVARTAGDDESPSEPPMSAEDLRAVVAAETQATLVIVAVDASGSMAGRRRLEAARAAVLSLLRDAYRRRDRLAMVVFRGESAEVVLRPTGSVEVARERLAELPSGGLTPLAAGLAEVTALVRTAQRTGGPRPAVVLVTDGRATAGGADPVEAASSAAAELASTGVACLVIDAETGPARLGLARSLASTLSAKHVLLEDVERRGGGEALAAAIRDRVMALTSEKSER